MDVSQLPSSVAVIHGSSNCSWIRTLALSWYTLSESLLLKRDARTGERYLLEMNEAVKFLYWLRADRTITRAMAVAITIVRHLPLLLRIKTIPQHFFQRSCSQIMNRTTSVRNRRRIKISLPSESPSKTPAWRSRVFGDPLSRLIIHSDQVGELWTQR